MELRERYGPWALVAGASVGLGAAIADAYAARGENVVILARRAEELEATAQRIRSTRGVEVRTIVADLQDADIWERIEPLIADIDLGMFVYNACQGFREPFLDDSLDAHFTGLAVNCRTPAVLAWHIGRMMRARARGSLVICCSMGGMGGQIGRAHYAAGKAYEWVLCEGLWGELRDHGVDVLGYMVGTTSTPGLLAALPQAADPEMRERLSIQTPEECAARLLEVLDQGPVAFPSARHEQMMSGRGDISRADRVLATGRAATAPASLRSG
jgi:short-subunit dehydrogenase